MDNDNILRFIGLMRRAGALTLGADASFDACRTGRARLILTAADASPRTRGAAAFAARERETPLIVLPCGKAELGRAAGAGDCAVMTVCDIGFAIALCQKTGNHEPLQALERRQRREQKKHRVRGKTGTSARRGSHS